MIILRNTGRKTLPMRHNASIGKKKCSQAGISRLIFFVVVGLLSAYAFLLRRALEIQTFEQSQSPEQCRTQTQLCMAEAGATGSRCTSQQELPLPWAPRGFQNAKPSPEPLVCVVVTTYNVQDYVGFCLESVLRQTYKKLQVIVVDDASTDLTTKEVQRYADTDSRVRLIELRQNTNGGTGQPSNIGMEQCSEQSEYIMLVDGDDFMEKDAVGSVLEQALKIDADVIMANFDSFTVNETTSEMSFTPAYDSKRWENLPAGIPFNVLTHPDVLRASPVPWRKMYKRSFVKAYDLKFPEGDYFYEDNTFHWVVLGHAARVCKIDKVLFHHRKQRAGQTSYAFDQMEEKEGVFSGKWWEDFSNAARVSGYMPNLYQVGQLLFTGFQQNVRSTCTQVAVKDIAEVYFNWLKASRWIVPTQKSNDIKDKFNRLFLQYRDYWLDQMPADYKAGFSSSILDFKSETEKMDIDLSLILPTLDVVDLLPNLLDSIYLGLDRPGFTFEVYAIDDGSSDGTVEILRDFAANHQDNFFLLQTSSTGNTQLGAGRARNRAIPLVEGRYVYFVDTDDIYDFPALADTVDAATKRDIDVFILPYKTEYVRPEGTKVEGMLSKDQRGWNRVWSSWWFQGTHQEDRQLIALDLINYPWKQLTSSKLIRDADIFFGPTRVHNDVQFHWTSITTSRNLQFHDKVICTHRKFDARVRGQLTEVKTAARLTAIDAIGLTQRALARQGAFDGRAGEETLKLWKLFVKDLIKWAAERVPEEWMLEYETRSNRIFHAWEELEPSALRTWPYWGEGISDPIIQAKPSSEA